MRSHLSILAAAVAFAGTAAVAVQASATPPPMGPGPVLTPQYCAPMKAAPITSRAPVLSQWQLYLPVSAKGLASGNDAALLSPARVDPPYLTQRPAGSLSFYAPSVGATTTNSLHPRTELLQRGSFHLVLGSSHTLTATLAVTQVPNDTHKIIVGQLHAAEGPFVTLRYSDGRINVIAVDGSDCTLLNGIAIGQRFSYQITQNGWELIYTASTTVDGQTETASEATMIPAAFRDADAQFSAGDYEQAAVRVAGSAGRVTFYDLSVGG
jgi:hypothetical protein